jgi:hypothetical protein
MNPPPNEAERWREARLHKPAQVARPADQELASPAPSHALPVEKTPRAKRRGATGVEPTMLDVEAALEEITRVPAAGIHRTAAYAWASRAIAGYRVCAGKLDVQEGLSYLYLGEHYREAALAHAAMGEAWQPLFAEIEAAMDKDRAHAFETMRSHAPAATR